jgi:hypothetical protein
MHLSRYFPTFFPPHFPFSVSGLPFPVDVGMASRGKYVSSAEFLGLGVEFGAGGGPGRVHGYLQNQIEFKKSVLAQVIPKPSLGPAYFFKWVEGGQGSAGQKSPVDILYLIVSTDGPHGILRWLVV